MLQLEHLEPQARTSCSCLWEDCSVSDASYECAFCALKSQQAWNHRVASVTVQGHHREKHKIMDFDEDDEVPQNEPGTSSKTHPTVPVLPLRQGLATNSKEPLTSTNSTSSKRQPTSTSSENESTDDDDEHGEGEYGPALKSTRSRDWGRTIWPMMSTGPWGHNHTSMQPQPDPSVLWQRKPEENRISTVSLLCQVWSDHCHWMKWSMITATYKSAFRMQLKIKPETCWNVACLPVEKQQEHMPKCGLVHEKKHQLRKYEDNTSSLLKRNTPSEKSWIDHEVFDLVALRKVRPKNYVTRRWVLTVKTNKQGNFLRTKAG